MHKMLFFFLIQKTMIPGSGDSAQREFLDFSKFSGPEKGVNYSSSLGSFKLTAWFLSIDSKSFAALRQGDSDCSKCQWYVHFWNL